jgi:hypothetical protein
MKSKWELVGSLDRKVTDKFLEEGWEPFAVDNGVVYFRRQIIEIGR